MTIQVSFRWIIYILAGIKHIHKYLDEFEFNKNSHKILDGFEILQDRTRDCRVSCP